ncbi:MAG: sporulation protein YqfC [Clostridium sp.]|uniref:sporulation protein YqfC n=1 Tax=Clostridium TaxID=1485 RepID=UPI0021527BE1|nr:sporulation protein YqfC [Clostridium sp. LY3-2]MCR6513494.1 sporulation protein YqfC [Clostridium sp. LY3-2]
MFEEIREKKERVVDSLGLPKEVLYNIPKITVLGNQEVLIENHKGLLKFTNEEILLNSRLGKITIEGSKLNIMYIGDDTIAVKGEFNSIYYKEKVINERE